MKLFNTSGFKVVVLTALVFLFAFPACGAEAQDVNSNIKMYFNGSTVTTDVNPFIDENSRTMVPLRFISEKWEHTLNGQWESGNHYQEGRVPN